MFYLLVTNVHFLCRNSSNGILIMFLHHGMFKTHINDAQIANHRNSKVGSSPFCLGLCTMISGSRTSELDPQDRLHYMLLCYLVTKLCLTHLPPYVPTRFLCPWNFPGKNTVVGCHFLLQGILLTQGSNPRLLLWQADSLPLSHQGSP